MLRAVEGAASIQSCVNVQLQSCHNPFSKNGCAVKHIWQSTSSLVGWMDPDTCMHVCTEREREKWKPVIVIGHTMCVRAYSVKYNQLDVTV